MKLTLREQKGSRLNIAEMDENFKYLQGLASEGGQITGPNESNLYSLPNEYTGWQRPSANPFYQAVELDSVSMSTTLITSLTGSTGELVLSSGSFTVFNGDIITISGSSISTNNGDWVVTAGTGTDTITLMQPGGVHLTDDDLMTSPDLTVAWTQRTIVEFDWVQAQLADGTLIWETYDYTNWNGDYIYGYWVAMKPNETTGKYEYLSHLQMSNNFWDYWYNYTVKVDGEPNSVILTTLMNGFGQSNNVDSLLTKLTIDETNQIVLTETIHDLNTTWGDLYTDLSGNSITDFHYTNPWWCSDNDWYGMMYGPTMGWYWMWDISDLTKLVGFNMLTGATKMVDISTTVLDVENVFQDGTDKGIIQFYSHPKYEFLVVMDSRLYSNPPTALWSPNFTDPTYATILDMKNQSGNNIHYAGSFYGHYSINLDYFINVSNYYEGLTDSSYGLSLSRIKLGDPIAKTEYSTTLIPGFAVTSAVFYIYERENSVISSPYNNDIGNSYYNFVYYAVWRNDSESAKTYESNHMYPNMLEDDKLTNWDRIWNFSTVSTLMNTFNSNSF